MSDALRKAVQLVLALNNQPYDPARSSGDRLLDPMAEQQLRDALEEPEFPWDGQDIEVNQVWSSRDPNGTCPYPGDEGEIQVNMTPAGLINLCLNGMSDESGNAVTAVTIFTALPPMPEPEPDTTPMERIYALADRITDSDADLVQISADIKREAAPYVMGSTA